MFAELLEAASFVALYAGLRIVFLNLNVQAMLQPVALLIVLSANSFLRGGLLRPLGVKRDGLPDGLLEWWAIIVVVFILLPVTLFLVFRRLWPAFVEYLKNYVGGIGALDFRVFVPFALVFTFVEEAIARGYLQTCLASALGAWGGIISASAFFALVHWTPGRDSPEARVHVCAGFAAGTLLGWMFASTGNLLVPWIAHAAWDISLLTAMSFFGTRTRSEASGAPVADGVIPHADAGQSSRAGTGGRAALGADPGGRVIRPRTKYLIPCIGSEKHNMLQKW
ncbi:MAG: CPBP family intramembrane metalloprotease [Planctomycetota bacterium]|nr:CPBP family intramembrane metalloprotease [Planctomycetota bacterium]